MQVVTKQKKKSISPFEVAPNPHALQKRRLLEDCEIYQCLHHLHHFWDEPNVLAMLLGNIFLYSNYEILNTIIIKYNYIATFC